jgi:hypothetical protein
MTREEHIQRHRELHQSLDELLADFIRHTNKTPSGSTVMDLLKWSDSRVKNPAPHCRVCGTISPSAAWHEADWCEECYLQNL